jgi:PAS domain-containing protein
MTIPDLGTGITGYCFPIGMEVTSMLKKEFVERRQVEASLRESEEKFRVLAETSHAMIFLYQGERHIYFNPAAERLTGYKKEEFLESNRQLVEAHEELVRKEKLALVGQLAACVGHDLRNPLGVVANAVFS